MKKKFSFLILLGVILVSLTTACSNKSSKQTKSTEPSASSLINAKFNSSFANGHFTQTTNSNEINLLILTFGLFH